MKPYSQDLRERVIAALEAGDDTQADVAEQFGVSLSFVEKLWSRRVNTGSCAALQRGGGRRRALKEDEQTIRQLVADEADLNLSELCERVAAAGGATVTVKTMCLELQRLDLPRKKSLSMQPSGTRRVSARRGKATGR